MVVDVFNMGKRKGKRGSNSAKTLKRAWRNWYFTLRILRRSNKEDGLDMSYASINYDNLSRISTYVWEDNNKMAFKKIGHKDENGIILAQKGGQWRTPVKMAISPSISTKGRKLIEQLRDHRRLKNVAHYLKMPGEMRQHRSFPHRRTQYRRRASSQTVQHLDGAAARFVPMITVRKGLAPLQELFVGRRYSSDEKLALAWPCRRVVRSHTPEGAGNWQNIQPFKSINNDNFNTNI